MKVKKLISHIAWAIITLALVYIAGCFFPWFNIGDIKVVGADSLTEEQVVQLCGVSKGDNLLRFNTIRAKESLMKNTYVKAARLKRKLPNTLVIDVEEYRVRGYIPHMNSYLYIDEEGRVLDSRADMKKQLPIVTGLKFSGFTLGKVLDTDNPAAYRAVKEMANLFNNYELSNRVIKMDVSDMDNIHLYVDKLDIKFGTFERANDKVANLKAILEETDTSVPGVLDLTSDVATFRYLS